MTERELERRAQRQVDTFLQAGSCIYASKIA